jgi:hypothetical protein
VLAYLDGRPGGPRDAQRAALTDLLHTSGLAADTPQGYLPRALLHSGRIAGAAVATAIGLTEVDKELLGR